MPLDDTNTDAGSGSDDPFSKFNGPTSPILFAVGERAIGWKTRDDTYAPINTHKAIVRVFADQPHVLSVVGANYRLIHNRELFSHVESILCKEMQPHELADVQVKDKVAGWGRTCYREYVFPNITCRLGGSTKSDIAFRMIVQNGYGGSALRMHAGAIEFYCTNGIVSGEYESTYRKHTSGLHVAGVGSTVHHALESFAKSQDKWRAWAQKHVPHGKAMELLRELASTEKLRENLQAQYLRERDVRGDTLWTVYSALTYYASHSDGEFSLRRTVNEQDTVASTMLQRELSVARMVETDAWRKLENA